MSKQDDIDKAADQAATQAAAIVITWMRDGIRHELKGAIKDIYWELWRELFVYLYRANWVRLLAGLLTLASAITLWLKENT